MNSNTQLITKIILFFTTHSSPFINLKSNKIIIDKKTPISVPTTAILLMFKSLNQLFNKC